jgi:hypothetical protein
MFESGFIFWVYTNATKSLFPMTSFWIRKNLPKTFCVYGQHFQKCVCSSINHRNILKWNCPPLNWGWAISFQNVLFIPTSFQQKISFQVFLEFYLFICPSLVKLLHKLTFRLQAQNYIWPIFLIFHYKYFKYSKLFLLQHTKFFLKNKELDMESRISTPKLKLQSRKINEIATQFKLIKSLKTRML